VEQIFILNHLITLSVFSPLIGLAIVLALPKEETHLIRWAGFLATLVPLALTLLAWFRFTPGQPGYQFEQLVPWYPQIGINYHVGLDGISLPLLLLTALLTPWPHWSLSASPSASKPASPCSCCSRWPCWAASSPWT